MSYEKTIQQISEEAKHHFQQFNQGFYALNEFKAHLTLLAYDLGRTPNSGFYPGQDTEWFIQEYIDAQFELYKSDPKKYAYLLSLQSSGSLLTQFEPYTG